MRPYVENLPSGSYFLAAVRIPGRVSIVDTSTAEDFASRIRDRRVVWRRSFASVVRVIIKRGYEILEGARRTFIKKYFNVDKIGKIFDYFGKVNEIMMRLNSSWAGGPLYSWTNSIHEVN